MITRLANQAPTNAQVPGGDTAQPAQTDKAAAAFHHLFDVLQILQRLLLLIHKKAL